MINAAVGRIRGKASLQVEEFSVASQIGDARGHGLAVDVWTLQDVINQSLNPRIDLLKMDCEGCEYSSLIWASESLIRQIGAIVCEYHAMAGHNPAEIAGRLTALGFRVQMDAALQGLIHASQASADYQEPVAPTPN
jgi:hypothetical protein